jgi:high affinity sulfate transporter 1
VRTYERHWTRPDVVAGVVLAAILVPQGMAYADLAGLPPVTGLYTTIACLIGYAVFGPSRILVLGPDSSVSPMIFAAITPLLVGADASQAIVLAGMLAIMVGLIELALGLGRLGFVADLLSNEVQVGYMNGLALVIIVGQLPKLFGFSTDASGFGHEVQAFFTHLGDTVGAALAVGLAVLAVLLVLPRVTRRLPAVLVAIAGATIVSALFDLHAHGVATVGTLPRGVPVPSFPWTRLSDVGPLVLAAIGITLVSLADTIATSSSFGARRGEEVDPNQEMIGIGTANVFAGLLQGFAVSTSGSRTAVVEQAGARSQVASVVGAAVVAAMLLFFNGLLADLPQSALAAVLIGAALSLMDLDALRRYWQVRKSALFISLIASLGVVVLGVLQGIVLAIVLAILLFFRRSWQPHGAVLGRVADLDGWHSLEQHPEATPLPGVVVYRWEAPLFFANCSRFRDDVRAAVRRFEPAWVVVQCEAITDVDVTAARMLEQLDLELNATGVHMAFAELRTRLQELVSRYGLFETLDRDRFYPSLGTALTAIESD